MQFLCFMGNDNNHLTGSLLQKKEKERLHRWLGMMVPSSPSQGFHPLASRIYNCSNCLRSSIIQSSTHLYPFSFSWNLQWPSARPSIPIDSVINTNCAQSLATQIRMRNQTNEPTVWLAHQSAFSPISPLDLLWGSVVHTCLVLTLPFPHSFTAEPLYPNLRPTFMVHYLDPTCEVHHPLISILIMPQASASIQCLDKLSSPPHNRTTSAPLMLSVTASFTPSISMAIQIWSYCSSRKRFFTSIWK